MHHPSIVVPSPGRPWRCHACGALLGVLRSSELHLKYRDLQHWVTGRCRHTCRRCGAMNTIDVPSAGPDAGGSR